MAFQERTLTCTDCGTSFPFTTEEQQFHSERGYTNEPKRCPSCREARRGGGRGDGGFRQMHPAVCAECGKDTEVPFRPTGDRPVYCWDCFHKRGGGGSGGGDKPY